MNEVAISVIIPTYRDWKRLGLCLRALDNQTIARTRFEVIVANNDPKDVVPATLKRSNVSFLEVAKPGSYAARNAALAVATGRVVAFTDSDCVPSPTWLEAALDALSSKPDARATGPIPIFREEGGTRLAYLYQFHTAFRQRESAERGLCTTANLVVARSTFDAIGAFNEDLLSGGDFEWNKRAAEAGVPLIFREDMAVEHPARPSIKAILKKRRRTTRAEAVSQPTTVWQKAKYLLKPPVGRIVFDRGAPTLSEKILLFAVQYTMNIYAFAQFSAVRVGLVKQVRE
jgi:GT2 family glycosyltransferase